MCAHVFVRACVHMCAHVCACVCVCAESGILAKACCRTLASEIEQEGMKTVCRAKASEIEQGELKIRCRALPSDRETHDGETPNANTQQGEMNRLDDVPRDGNSENWCLAKTLQDHLEVHPNNDDTDRESTCDANTSSKLPHWYNHFGSLDEEFALTDFDPEEPKGDKSAFEKYFEEFDGEKRRLSTLQSRI